MSIIIITTSVLGIHSLQRSKHCQRRSQEWIINQSINHSSWRVLTIHSLFNVVLQMVCSNHKFTNHCRIGNGIPKQQQQATIIRMRISIRIRIRKQTKRMDRQIDRHRYIYIYIYIRSGIRISKREWCIIIIVIVMIDYHHSHFTLLKIQSEYLFKPYFDLFIISTTTIN